MTNVAPLLALKLPTRPSITDNTAVELQAERLFQCRPQRSQPRQVALISIRAFASRAYDARNHATSFGAENGAACSSTRISTRIRYSWKIAPMVSLSFFGFATAFQNYFAESEMVKTSSWRGWPLTLPMMMNSRRFVTRTSPYFAIYFFTWSLVASRRRQAL